MRASRFVEALHAFKEQENPEAVLLVASHKDYVNIASAWLHAEVERKRRLPVNDARSEAETWAWLWENVRFSPESLQERSGVPEERFEQRLATLIANRALYPDGTVNSFVRRYLREKVLRLLGVDARTRRALKAAKEEAHAPAL